MLVRKIGKVSLSELNNMISLFKDEKQTLVIFHDVNKMPLNKVYRFNRHSIYYVFPVYDHSFTKSGKLKSWTKEFIEKGLNDKDFYAITIVTQDGEEFNWKD